MVRPNFTRYVAYFRVSTPRQGHSGLGLEAQQQAVKAFRAADSRILAQYVEVESGTDCDRPELKKALAHARRSKAVLIVAKLDRLARNAAFLLSILEGMGENGVVFCDFPQMPAGPVGKLVITMLAAVAEFEAGINSQRTCAAMAVCKARGVKLGSARPGFWSGKTKDGRSMAEARLEGARKATEAAAIAKRIRRNKHYAEVYPIIQERRARGETWQTIADFLNCEGYETVNGMAWSAHSLIDMHARKVI